MTQSSACPAGIACDAVLLTISSDVAPFATSCEMASFACDIAANSCFIEKVCIMAGWLGIGGENCVETEAAVGLLVLHFKQGLDKLWQRWQQR